jgi:putative phosphoribosyl transferase
LQQQPVGLFGASTGAAAAVMTAAAFPNQIRAVVSRGGRPDLAQQALARVQAPTLFIVGGHDNVVLDLNRKAMQEMNCIKSLKVIPGATHLFEEPGSLEEVASAASDWFAKCMQHPQDIQIASGWR